MNRLIDGLKLDQHSLITLGKRSSYKTQTGVATSCLSEWIHEKNSRHKSGKFWVCQIGPNWYFYPQSLQNVDLQKDILFVSFSFPSHLTFGCHKTYSWARFIIWQVDSTQWQWWPFQETNHQHQTINSAAAMSGVKMIYRKYLISPASEVLMKMNTTPIY